MEVIFTQPPKPFSEQQLANAENLQGIKKYSKISPSDLLDTLFLLF